MKRILLFAMALVLALAGFSACGQTRESAEETTTAIEGGPGVIAPFNVPQWLEIEANRMAFEYIGVPVYQDIWARDEEPVGYVEATETDKDCILDFLSEVFFASIPAPPPWPPGFMVDFEFGMNEPFVFFGFDEKGLFVWLPSPEGTNYLHYKALFADYEALYWLREYIGEMRLGYFLEGPEPAQ